MSPDTIIVRFVGALILALLTGTWTPIPADRISPDLPASVSFSAEWQPASASGTEVDQLIVLGDGSTRLGATSSIVSPRRSESRATSSLGAGG